MSVFIRFLKYFLELKIFLPVLIRFVITDELFVVSELLIFAYYLSSFDSFKNIVMLKACYFQVLLVLRGGVFLLKVITKLFRFFFKYL